MDACSYCIPNPLWIYHSDYFRLSPLLRQMKVALRIQKPFACCVCVCLSIIALIATEMTRLGLCLDGIYHLCKSVQLYIYNCTTDLSCDVCVSTYLCSYLCWRLSRTAMIPIWYTPHVSPACVSTCVFICVFICVYVCLWRRWQGWVVPRWYVPPVHAANQLLSPNALVLLPIQTTPTFFYLKSISWLWDRPFGIYQL